MKRSLHARRLLLKLAIVLAIAIPVVIQGEVIYLKDGSAMRGKVIKLTTDSVYFETSFGSRVWLPREKIDRIDFGDSVRVNAPAGPAAQASGIGMLALRFKDDKVTSKISIHLKNGWDEHVRANWIVQTLTVGRETLFTYVDTTMDKTIRQGSDTEIKNNARLQDILIEVPSGTYNCMLTVRNAGGDEFDSAFVDRVDMTMVIDNVEIVPDRTTTIEVGIKKSGFLKMGGKSMYVGAQ